MLRLSRYERKEIIKKIGDRGHFDSKFQVEGVAPTNHFCTVNLTNECLTTLPLTVFTQRNFVAEFLQVKCDFFYGNRRFCVFETPFGNLEVTYDDHLRLFGKHVVDFLLVLIKLFSLGVADEEIRANIC